MTEDKKRPNKSLGWLSESAVQPKKRKEIEGVGGSSLLALKSQVFKKQQEVGDRGEAGDAKLKRPRQGPIIAPVLHRSNAGVAERDQKDRLDIKAPSDRLADSRAALERKTALYDRFVSGQGSAAEAERYEVDFSKKEPAWAAIEAGSGRGGGGVGYAGGGDGRERKREAWAAELQAGIHAEEAGDKRRELIEQVAEETLEGREKAVAARDEKEAAEARKRERLKQAFLRKRLQAAVAQQRQAAGAAAAAGVGKT